MINQQLLDFIKQQLQAGLTKEVISKQLLDNGWTLQDVEEGFKTLTPPTVLTPQSQTPPPPQIIQSQNNSPKKKSSWNPFSHKGRIGRLRYFLSTLILSISYVLISIVILFFSFTLLLTSLSMFLGSVNTKPSLMWYFATLITPILPFLVLAIVVFIIGFSLAAKRFHDLNKSGWHSLLLIIPIYNIYLILGLFLQTGTGGENQYGDDPLPAEKNHNDFLNKIGSSVIFKIIIIILLFALSVVSGYQDSLAKKQAEQKLQQNIINSLTTTPSNTNNSSGNTTPSTNIPSINTTTSDITNGWKSKEVYNANPSICYTIKYPSNFPPRDYGSGDVFLLFVDSSVQAGIVPPDADIINVNVSPDTTISAESKMSGTDFYNYYSKELHPNVAINTFSTDSGLKAEEFIDNSKNGPTAGMWIIYVEVPKKDGKTNIIVIKNSLTLTYNLSTSLEMAKTITSSCGH